MCVDAEDDAEAEDEAKEQEILEFRVAIRAFFSSGDTKTRTV